MHAKGTSAMEIIAHIRTDFPTKFGLPRQSGLVDALRGTIVFTPKYRDPRALIGMEGYSHLWLIWQFSESICEEWSPTVRPPRLGGNTRLGVFATRSPFRPNAIGLSCVQLEGVRHDAKLGPVLDISCADLMDGTPVLDIKPYIPFADAHPEASDGYTAQTITHGLKVHIPDELVNRVPANKRAALEGVLAQDPRPSYQEDPQRIYGFGFAGMEIRFRVEGSDLTVTDILPEK